MNQKGKNIVTEALVSVFKRDNDISIIKNYFSDAYEQYVDDEFIDYHDFVAHIEKVRSLTKDVSIKFLQLIGEDEIVFSRHEVTSLMLDGTTTVFIVFAEFHLKNDKIVKCIETTRLVKGNKEHQNLGSDK